MTKHCPHCGKELPPESNFCPYCMTKLAQEEKYESKHPKKLEQHKKLLYFGIPIAAVLLISLTLFLVLRKPAAEKTALPVVDTSSVDSLSSTSSFASSEVSEPESTVSEGSAISSGANTVDYGTYVGKWYDEASQNKSDIMKQGGDCLQIVSINAKQMVFSLTAVTEPPGNRIAQISNVSGTISGDTVSFAFTDDGWGNGGKGTLKLKNNEIYAKVDITEPDSSAQMNLAMQCYFKKVSGASVSTSAPVELSQILTYFPDIRGRLGEETKKSSLDDATGYEVHTFGAVQVFVDVSSDTVKQFLVDFTDAQVRKAYTFDDLDGTASYDKIIAKYGASKDTYSANGEKTIGYSFKQKAGYYVKYTFDSTGKLKNIYCFDTAGQD